MLSNLGIVIVLLTITANFYISYSVFRNAPRSATHILLSFLSLTLAAWTLCNYLALSPADAAVRLFWVRIVMLITSPFGPLIFLLSKTFPRHTLGVSRRFLYFILVTTVLIALLCLTPLVFSDLKNTANGAFELSPGPGMLVFGINFFVFLTWGFVLLIKNFRKSTGILRSQFQLFLVGISVSFTLMTLTNFIAVVIFRTIELTFLGPPFTLIMVAAIGYAIVRHKFLNIKVLATEVFTVSLWLILLLRIFLYATSLPVLVFDASVFIISLVFGSLLVRSVRTEVEQKEKLSSLTSQLKLTDAKKDEFINMAAHELRAPLTAIKGFLSMVIGGDAGKISPKAKEFLDDSAVSAERMIRLVNNMLNVGRIEEGRMVYQSGDVNVSSVADSVYKEFLVEAKRKALDFKLDISKNIKDLVIVDEDKLHEVIVNFVSNAIKYTDHGYVKIQVVNPSTHVVRLNVIDTGGGISEEEMRKLFHKFYRVESKVGKTIGTGLGLYISKLLVERFGGTIGVDSEVNKGSTFWFELPLKKEDNVADDKTSLQKSS